MMEECESVDFEFSEGAVETKEIVYVDGLAGPQLFVCGLGTLLQEPISPVHYFFHPFF